MKYLFIDTSVYKNCFFEQVKGLDFQILGKIYDRLNDDQFRLLLPEIIKVETLAGLEEEFTAFKGYVENFFDEKKNKKDESNKNKNSNIITSSLVKAKFEAISHIEKKLSETKKVINKIFDHKNTILIKINNDILQKGMLRSVLMKAPYTRESKVKRAYVKDQDCISYEAIISLLKKNKRKVDSLIFCIDDGDYYDQREPVTLKALIIEEMTLYAKRIVAFIDPLEMLIDEFKQSYSSDQVKKYKEEIIERPESLWSGSRPVDSVVSATTRSFFGGVTSLKSPWSINDDAIRYCPYCGHEILNSSDYDYGITFHSSRWSKIYCSNCYRRIEIN